MSSKLSSLLVQDGVVSVKRMEEAFQRQVIYGGSLDTVLLEMGALDEVTLIRYLYVASSLPAADLSGFDPGQVAPFIAKFPQKLSEKYHVVPAGTDAEILQVLVTESSDRRHLEELSFMLGLTLSPFVVPEVRLFESLEKVYGAKMPLRYGALLKKLGPPPALRPHGIPAAMIGASATFDAQAQLEVEVEQPEKDLDAAILDESEEMGESKTPSGRTLVGIAAKTRMGMAIDERIAEAVDAAIAPMTSALDQEKEEEEEPEAERHAISGKTLRGIRTEPLGGTPKVAEPWEGTEVEIDLEAGSAVDIDMDAAEKPPRTDVAGKEPVVDAGEEGGGIVSTTLVGIPTDVSKAASFSGQVTFREPARSLTGEIEVVKVHPVEKKAPVERSVEVLAQALAPPPEPEKAPETLAPAHPMLEPPSLTEAVPLEPSEAGALLAQAAHRDEIFQIFLRTAASRCAYAAVFVVYGDNAVGRMALNRGVPDTAQVAQVHIPLKSTSLFRTVVETGTQYYGPVQDEGLNLTILTQMERLSAPIVLLLPVVLKNRVVCFLYADDDAEMLPPEAVADLAPVAYGVSSAFQRLILQAKRVQFGRSKPTADGKLQAAPEPAKSKSAQRTPTGGWDRAKASTDTRLTTEAMASAASEPLPYQEIAKLLDELEQGGEKARKAFAKLSRSGHAALSAAASRFPGPIVVDRFAQHTKLPPANEHGPILDFMIRAGASAIPHLLPFLESTDPDVRYYAVLAFTQLPATEAIPQLFQRIFDEQPPVRKAAMEAIRSSGEGEGGVMEGILERLRGILRQSDPFYRSCAAEALGAFRDSSSVDLLIGCVDNASPVLAESAQRALLLITKQAFGRNAAEWKRWWKASSGNHRIVWMIDALVHQDVECRYVAAQELMMLTGQTFGYSFDLPPEERQIIMEQWQSWWESEGKDGFTDS